MLKKEHLRERGSKGVEGALKGTSRCYLSRDLFRIKTYYHDHDRPAVTLAAPFP